MGNKTSSLHMVRIQLDARRVVRDALSREIALRHADLGYLLHCHLAELFGNSAVQPFRVLSDRGREVPILGYTERDLDTLRRHALQFADPGRYASCAWDGFSSKPMPSDWKPNTRLGFEVRICPVVRLSSRQRISGKSGAMCEYPAGAEVDAWEHQTFFRDDGPTSVSREEAYAEWLRVRLGSAAALHSSRLRSFRRVRLIRRNHESPRKTRFLERPDATLEGEITVGDPLAFRNLLAGGVGRHRAFGFGMLLLRPVDTR